MDRHSVVGISSLDAVWFLGQANARGWSRCGFRKGISSSVIFTCALFDGGSVCCDCLVAGVPHDGADAAGVCLVSGGNVDFGLVLALVSDPKSLVLVLGSPIGSICPV